TAALKVDHGVDKCGYFSWSPEPIRTEDTDVVGISATLAQKLGIEDGTTVSISLCNSATSVSRIDVSPEMTSNLVQSSLLNQVRVVWPGQILVVWVSKSLHLSLHVDHIDSNSPVGLLEPLTDVVVAPPSGNSTSVEDPKHVPEDVKESGNVESSESITGGFWKSFTNLMSMGGNKGTVNIKPEEDEDSRRRAILRKCRMKPLPLLCRVHPLNPHHVENDKDKLLTHPFNVFIRRWCMPSIDTEEMSDRNGVLICKLTKVPLPSEIARTPPNKEGEQHGSKNSSSLLFDAQQKCIYARLVVIEDVYENLSDKAKEYLDRVTLRQKSGHVSILISDIARRSLNTKVRTRVSLEILPSSGHQLSGIQITPLETWEKDLKELETLCRSYIAEQVATNPLVINSKTILPVSTTNSVLISLLPTDVEYAVLDPERVRRCKFSVEEKSTQLEPPSLEEDVFYDQTCDIHLGSTMKVLLSEGSLALELSLKLTPLATTLLAPGSCLLKDNILILGTVGSGKSTLANSICRELNQPPHYVHSKNVDHLQKMMTQWLSECIYCQPSILILDDLASIAGVGSLTPVAAMLRGILTEYQSKNCISIIATAPSVLKLNSCLVAPRGTHIFDTLLEVPELNKTDRMEILKNITSQRPDIKTQDIENLDWERFAGKSDGFVVQDLVDLVDKAVFEAFKRAEGLQNSVPLLQRGVELFEGGSYTWDDVGGLSEVKQVLIEVLQWPSQYPELFEKAPLRHQSGLLLYGAPGTGKTLLAAAVAQECGLRAQSAKPCILFFDEFDSLAPRRGHDSTGVTDRVVNQLLTQLDGVESLHGVWVMAATSRPDLIDPALLRPGRLDRAILCPLPDESERLSILLALSRKLSLADDVDLEEIANNADGFTGADLQGVLNTAQLTAVEETIALKG
ncbi:Peroxisome biogenesis factor 1, partial [Blattella germanica]